MDHDNTGDELLELPVLSSEGEALVAQTLDRIFDPTLDMEEALPLVETLIDDLNAEAAGAAFETLQLTLQSLWKFFKALRFVRSEGNFVEARNLLESAARGLNHIGLDELRDLSIGMGVYSEAVCELQRMNLGEALELLAKVKGYLRSAGEFGSRFEPVVDHMEPDALFLSGLNALMALDFDTAKTLIDKASQAAEQVARDYYPEGDPLHWSFQGMARFHKAWYTFARARNDFSQFLYEKLAAEEDLAREAVEARDLLDKGDLENVLVRNMRHISVAFIHLLEVTQELAALMLDVLRSTFKPDMQTLRLLRQKVRAASDSASRAGPQAVTLVKSCNQLSNQINNLERLAKPRKRDFGALSGLVASALFLPLFLVVSWANSVFDVDLEGSTLITTCLVLALIGGFGFGAVKFRSLIFPGRTSESS